MSSKLAIFTLLSFCTTLTYAADLKAPFALPSAKLLPKGVRNLGFKNVLAEANDKYNNGGNQVVVADPFFKNITYGDLIKGKRGASDKGSIIQTMESVGATEDDKFAETIGQVNIKATAYVPVLAWGLSSKTTVAFALPVLQYSTNVDAGVRHTNADNYYSFLQALEKKGAGLKSAEFVNKMASPIQSKLDEYGYSPLANEQGTVMGDAKLVGKQKLLENEYNLLALQTELTLPTGKKANVDKVINVTGGDGQTDLGIGLLHDLSFAQYFTLSSNVAYTVQFKDKEEMRIPERQDSKLTPDKDSNTKRDLGDSLFSQVGLKMNWNGFNLGTGYSFQYKEKDKYTGSQYESERYSWLEQDTRQRMEALQLVAGYDTITLFRQGKFKAPLSLLLNYTMVTRGKNVVKDPVAALDFSLFF